MVESNRVGNKNINLYYNINYSDQKGTRVKGINIYEIAQVRPRYIVT